MGADGWRDRGWPDPAPTPGAHTHALADITDITAQGIALVNDTTAADQRTTLGLGTLATQSGTFSGTSSGTNTGDQTLGSLGAMADAQPAARAYNSANISVNNTTITALTFDSERFDTDTIHSTSSNTSRLTATTAGKYLIFGAAQFAQNATGLRLLLVRLNGATYIARDGRDNLGAGTPVDSTVCTIYSLSASDYVELCAYQDSGGALNVNAVSNYSPEFGMVRVSS